MIDRILFVKGVLWLSEVWQYSREDVVRHILSTLSKRDEDETNLPSDIVKPLLNMLRVFDKDRMDAETLLGRLLSQGLWKPKPKRVWDTRIGRRTDWGGTAVGQLTGKAGRYRSIIMPAAVDHESLSALATLGAAWLTEIEAARTLLRDAGDLTSDADLTERRNTLEASFQHLDVLVQPTPLTASVLHKLSHVEGGSLLVDLIGRLMGHHRRPLSHDDAERLGMLCVGTMAENNVNHMLEITATLAVVHGLVCCGWQKSDESPISQSRRPRDWYYRGFLLCLPGSDWTVEIGKKRGDNEVAAPNNGDATRSTRQHLFGSSVGAWQPDIRMQFSRPNGPDFWIVGDAKRSDGLVYPRTTGFPALMKYMVAFAHKIGWSVLADGTVLQKIVNGIPMPSGLLFCKQGIESIEVRREKLAFVEGFNIEDIGKFEKESCGRLFDVLKAISNALAPQP